MLRPVSYDVATTPTACSGVAPSATLSAMRSNSMTRLRVFGSGAVSSRLGTALTGRPRKVPKKRTSLPSANGESNERIASRWRSPRHTSAPPAAASLSGRCAFAAR